jgi:hypothetical protein
MPTSSGFARGNGSAGFAFWAFADAHMVPARMIAAMLRVKVHGVIFMVNSFSARHADVDAN